jgi:hypothetical protein
LSDKEKRQKNNLKLPHFEKIDRREEENLDGVTQLVDEEQDEEDDVDV